MKRILLSLALILGISTAAHAQFEQGTKYIGASLTGLSLDYSKNSKFHCGIDAVGGYYFADEWMGKANVGFNHTKGYNDFMLGAGARYNFRQNGIFLGASLEYEFQDFGKKTEMVTKADGSILEVSSNDRYNNIRIPIEIGYTFYVNQHIAIEPAIYSKMSINHFTNGTEFGFRIGLGYYFKKTIAGCNF